MNGKTEDSSLQLPNGSNRKRKVERGALSFLLDRDRPGGHHYQWRRTGGGPAGPCDGLATNGRSFRLVIASSVRRPLLLDYET